MTSWTARRPGASLRRAGILALVTAPAVAPACAQVADATDAAETITAEDMARRVGVIAHDSMQGRDTPSPGLDRTAAWIAGEFERMGLRGGAADDGFVQRYPLRSVALDTDRSSLVAGSTRLRFGDDLFPLFGEVLDGEAVGELVLVSGSGTPGLGDRLAVRDRHVVVVLPPDASGVDQPVFRTVTALRSAGARSVLVTSDDGDASWAEAARSGLRPSITKGWGGGGPSGAPFLPLLRIRMQALERLVEGRAVDLDALVARASGSIRVDEVPGLQVTLIQRLHEETVMAPNVVGILDGSDPGLRDEYVVYSAHMDHIGVGTPDARGDSIFNGADDDASGTSAVLEVAEAMASRPSAPRRSMIFLIVSGEEKGLWGSEWYADHPSVPFEAMVANLNADMVGRNWPDTIVAIGKEHSDLGPTLERVAAEHPELGMTPIDDLWPEERFYFRSDHFNFARHGVPILFFFNGTHPDYHGRDDEPERIDAEKAARIARLLYWLGVEIADADARPAWDPESYARIVTESR